MKVTLPIAIISVVVNAAGCLIVLFFIVEAVRWPGAENYAGLTALMFVPPILIIQAVSVVITFIASHKVISAAKIWLRWIACLLLAFPVSVIILGLILE